VPDRPLSERIHDSLVDAVPPAEPPEPPPSREEAGRRADRLVRALARVEGREPAGPAKQAAGHGASMADRLADALNQAAETDMVINDVVGSDGLPIYAGEPGFEAALESQRRNRDALDRKQRERLIARELGEVEPAE